MLAGWLERLVNWFATRSFAGPPLHPSVRPSDNLIVKLLLTIWYIYKYFFVVSVKCPYNRVVISIIVDLFCSDRLSIHTYVHIYMLWILFAACAARLAFEATSQSLRRLGISSRFHSLRIHRFIFFSKNFCKVQVKKNFRHGLALWYHTTWGISAFGIYW